MKKFILVIMSLWSISAVAAEHPFGLGIVLGDPTGISGRYNIDSGHAIDAALAWSNAINYHIHGDYLWQKGRVFNLDQQPVDWYVGVGARLRDRDKRRFDDDDDGLQLAARLPIGLNTNFRDPRIEVFVEVALAFNVVPDTSADLDLGLGGRFYF